MVAVVAIVLNFGIKIKKRSIVTKKRSCCAGDKKTECLIGCARREEDNEDPLAIKFVSVVRLQFRSGQLRLILFSAGFYKESYKSSIDYPC
jgi:hypothetical protein